MTNPASAVAVEKADNNNDENDIEIQDDEESSDESDDVEREFPNPFYDPNTGLIMKEPVVNPNGDSYEKSSLTTVDDPTTSTTYYPNRALKSIIEREIALNEQSIRGSLRRFDDVLQRKWSRLVDQSAFSSGQYRPLPESYYCPITCDLIVDPVITPDGVSYERNAIIHWVRVNGTSPLTRNALSVQQLRSNNNLYDLIQNEKGRTAESIHPSIRRWKESGITTTRPDVIPDIPSSETPPDNAMMMIDVNLPTTQAEIDERRRQQQQRTTNQSCTTFLFFTIILIFLLVPYIGVFGVVLFLILILSACSSSSSSSSSGQS